MREPEALLFFDLYTRCQHIYGKNIRLIGLVFDIITKNIIELKVRSIPVMLKNDL
jgi:hypothetical protein